MKHTIKIVNEMNNKSYEVKTETSNLVETIEKTLKRYQNILQNSIFIEILLKKYIELNNYFGEQDSYININRKIDGTIFIQIKFKSIKNKLGLEFFEGDLVKIENCRDDYNYSEDLIAKNKSYSEQLEEFVRVLTRDSSIVNYIQSQNIYEPQNTHEFWAMAESKALKYIQEKIKNSHGVLR